MILLRSSVQALDFEEALMTAVLPPAIAGIRTPSDSTKGKLKGERIRQEP